MELPQAACLDLDLADGSHGLSNSSSSSTALKFGRSGHWFFEQFGLWVFEQSNWRSDWRMAASFWAIWLKIRLKDVGTAASFWLVGISYWRMAVSFSQSWTQVTAAEEEEEWSAAMESEVRVRAIETSREKKLLKY